MRAEYKEDNKFYDESEEARQSGDTVFRQPEIDMTAVADIDSELSQLDRTEPMEDEAAEADTSFELHGPEDEHDELKDEENGSEEELAEEDTHEEQVRNAVIMIENFDGRAEIDTQQDEDLTALVESVGTYVDLTARESMVDEQFGSIDNDSVDRAAAQLSEVEKACEDYLEKARPFFRPGRKRKAAVSMLREEAEKIKDDREGLKKCYEDSYLSSDRTAEKEAADNGMGDDDGSGKKIEFIEENDVKQTDLSDRAGLNELTADKKADEVKLSEAARAQIYMVRAIGLVFGVGDWQAITDPEELIYREEGDSVAAVKVNMVPGLKNRLSAEVTEEEGRRLADSFKGDTHMIKIMNGMLKENSALVRDMEAATGVNKKVISARMRSIRRYLTEAAKGERGRK